jgi:hypothetical protein
MQSATPHDPIFAADGDFWSPAAVAAGPFGGLHGGAVSGLIVARLEAEARRNDAGVALSASVLLLRPAPMRTLQVSTRVLRVGGRVSAFEAVVSVDGGRAQRHSPGRRPSRRRSKPRLLRQIRKFCRFGRIIPRAGGAASSTRSIFATTSAAANGGACCGR